MIWTVCRLVDAEPPAMTALQPAAPQENTKTNPTAKPWLGRHSSSLPKAVEALDWAITTSRCGITIAITLVAWPRRGGGGGGGEPNSASPRRSTGLRPPPLLMNTMAIGHAHPPQQLGRCRRRSRTDRTRPVGRSLTTAPAAHGNGSPRGGANENAWPSAPTPGDGPQGGVGPKEMSGHAAIIHPITGQRRSSPRPGAVLWRAMGREAHLADGRAAFNHRRLGPASSSVPARCRAREIVVPGCAVNRTRVLTQCSPREA